MDRRIKPNKTCMATPTSPSVFDAPTKLQPQPRDQRWLPLVGVPSLFTFLDLRLHAFDLPRGKSLAPRLLEH